MAVEKERGCGFRQCGALYLVADDPMFIECGRLPLPCAEPFTRSFAMKSLMALLEPGRDVVCSIDECAKPESVLIPPGCRMQWPTRRIGEQVGFMFVGETSYTPESFMAEAVEMGVSKRVPGIPDGLVLGKTGVVLAYKRVFRYASCVRCGDVPEVLEGPDNPMLELVLHGSIEILVTPCKDEKPHDFMGPGLFTGFVPQRVECLVEDDRLDEEWVGDLRARGVTIIEVPQDDFDHGCRPRGERGVTGEQDYRSPGDLRHRRSGRQRRE